MAGGSRIAVIAALFGNLIIAIAKLVAGLASGSAAMLAEAAHSFSDVGNQLLLMLGISRSQQPPSEKYPFGTGKAAYFWPFMVAILLFGVAGTYSLFEGINKFRHPHEVHDIALSLAILGGAFIIEAVVLFIALRQAIASAREQNLGLGAFLEQNRDASLLTIIVEDTLALIGLPIAAASLILTKMTGDGRYDAGGSALIGVLLMGFALYLGTTVRSLLLGRGLSANDLQTLRRIVEADEDIVELRSMRTMHLGPESALLGAEVTLRGDLEAKAAAAVLARLEAQFVEAVPELKHVYLEDH